MKILVLITLAATVLLLTGCQTSQTVRDTENQSTRSNLAGNILTLHQDLELRPDRARAFIQDGESRMGFNSYRTHCAMEIDNVQHGGTTINAGQFMISRVQRDLTQIVMRESLDVASLLQTAAVDDGGTSAYYSGYHFWLSSAEQPQVRRLSCYGIYAQLYEVEPPTLEQIRATLGELISLN